MYINKKQKSLIPNTLIKDAFNDKISLENSLCIFKSINNILYLIYTNMNNWIICYNLIDNYIINQIKYAHKEYITNYRYFLDKNNKRDLIISISSSDNNLKLWNINKLECLLDIKNINQFGFLLSACFLEEKNQNYIITSNFSNSSYFFDSLRAFDLNGKKVKEINNSKDNTYFIDSFYDSISSKSYIISGNNGFIKSYDFNQNKIYNIYGNKDNNIHKSLIIYKKKDIVKLIDLNGFEYINIFNFHSGLLLKKIKINDNIYCSCLLNNNFLYLGNDKGEIKLLSLNEGIIVYYFKADYNYVSTIRIFEHPNLGECLISLGTQILKTNKREYIPNGNKICLIPNIEKVVKNEIKLWTNLF